ncbi:hypothetical protein BH11VER1_BH11VER1_36090 [soil metagenome]
MSQNEPKISSSPLYGCAILLIAACTFGGIVGWTLYSGYRQDKEIGFFTVDKAEALPVANLDAAQKDALSQRLKTFAESAKKGEKVVLELTMDDLNALLVLAADSEVGDYRSIVWFTGIDATGKLLMADLCWPMNGLFLKGESKRYLVGQGGFEPTFDNKSFDLHIVTLTVPGKTVSPGFLRNLGNWPWLNLAKLKPEIAAVLGKITAFEVVSEKRVLRLIADPAVKPAS